jgi:HPt (histidine-containing phosphotransfer) domain-containing protein
MFLKETEKRLGELDAAIEQNDWKQAQHSAHTIKGTAGNFKASRLADLARECESAASRSEDETSRILIGQMREAFDHHRNLLENEPASHQ